MHKNLNKKVGQQKTNKHRADEFKTVNLIKYRILNIDTTNKALSINVT